MTDKTQELLKQAEKMFPVINSDIKHIPWSVAQRARHKGLWSCQTLERLAERGGFNEEELNRFYPAWRLECAELETLKARIKTLADELRGYQGKKIYIYRQVASLYKNISDLEDKLTEEKDKSSELEDALVLISRLGEPQSWKDSEFYGTPKEIALSVLAQTPKEKE